MTTNSLLLPSLDFAPTSSNAESDVSAVSFPIAYYLPSERSSMFPKKSGEEFIFWISQEDIPAECNYTISFGVENDSEDAYRINICYKTASGFKIDLSLIDPKTKLKHSVLFTNSQPPVEGEELVYQSWCFRGSEEVVPIKTFTLKDLLSMQVNLEISPVPEPFF